MSEQSELFIFSPQAIHSTSNAIVNYALTRVGSGETPVV